MNIPNYEGRSLFILTLCTSSILIMASLHQSSYRLRMRNHTSGFYSPQSTDILLFLKNRDVIVTKTSKEWGAADAGRATADQSDLRVVALGHLLRRRQTWHSHLRNTHPTEHLQTHPQNQSYSVTGSFFKMSPGPKRTLKIITRALKDIQLYVYL